MRKVLLGLMIGVLFAAGTALSAVVTEQHVVPASTTVENQVVTVQSKGKTSVVTYSDTDVWPGTTIQDTDTIPDPVTVTVTVTGTTSTTPPPPPAQCADSADNDGDGLVDLADPGCSSSSDNDETNPAPPPPGTADLYLNGSTGNDASTCTQVAPCRSFARAYTVAQGLAASPVLVQVSGTFGDQFFAGGAQASQGSGTKAVIWRGETGNKVRSIHIGSPNMTFDGLNLDADGGTMPGGSAQFENGGDPVVFKNGSIGDTHDSKGALIDGPDVVFDNVRFHDVVLVTSGVHTECIQALWVPRLVLRNSTFTNCAIMGLSLGYPNYWNPAPPPYDGVVIEGNTFNAPNPSNNYSLAIWSNRYTGSCTDGCDWGAMHNYSIKNNYVWTLINRQYEDSTTVTCGNTGPGAPANWQEPCP